MLTDPTPLAPRSVRARRAVRRAVLLRRRPLAALCLAVAVLAGLRSVSPPPPETATLAVATADLPAGHVLTAEDLERQEVPPDAVPDGATPSTALTGRSLAAPLRRGEPVTDVRLVGRPLVASYASRVALPVRLPDAGSVSLLRVGDRIDLVAADPQGTGASVVSADAIVVTLPASAESVSASDMPGRLVVVAVAEGDVTEVVDALARSWVSYAFSR